MPTHVGFGQKVGDGTPEENQQETNELGQYTKGSTSPDSERTQKKYGFGDPKPDKKDFGENILAWIKAVAEWKEAQVEKDPIKEKRESVFNEFGSQFGLDESKINESSLEELEGLLSAFSVKAEYEKKFDEVSLIEEKAKELGQLGTVFGVWKYDSPNAKDFYDNPKFAEKIKDKYEFLENLGTDDALQKIESLKNLEKAAQDYANFIHDEYYPAKAELEAIDVESADNTIASFQNQNSPYSEFRKKNAKSVGFSSSKNHSAEELFGSFASKQWESLTKDEKNILETYTWTYSWAQEPLLTTWYSGSNTPDGGFEKSIKLMDSALDKCTYPFDCWVQRGMNTLNINGKDISYWLSQGDAKKLIGTTFRNPAFMSCGSSKGTGFTSEPYILNLYCPKGTHMHFIKPNSQYVHENETIIGRGYEMRITKIEKKGFKTYIDIDIIVGSDTKESKEQTLKEAMKYAG